MIKLRMNILQQIAKYINPVQTSVLTCDCPIVVQGKYLLWHWLEIYGEDKFPILLG